MRAKNQIQPRTDEPDVGLPPPKAGDRFRCASCGTEIEVTTDCRCQTDEHVHFHCCGRELQPV